ncbi:hypothetical protein M441DRAFT_55915 [Trichoderma asperellum CBS 433.97]|uniref:Uncharacterized protein n=1 Tax=Trichoderma asperellum (strain ATCC 204424 / CBS 433.97 / NBRC 101777) TaxID=1042311 RepID=A0A2T3ZDH8_TRIA4|nr:hypothetical protein M441DRAFT_55915 [Trichoderma asperellum CBS 433.97]PTB42863.1 hypothetical protein M441DRAFT_55915 [Trichoderma asperellum CBS 433.97]
MKLEERERWDKQMVRLAGGWPHGKKEGGVALQRRSDDDGSEGISKHGTPGSRQRKRGVYRIVLPLWFPLVCTGRAYGAD